MSYTSPSRRRRLPVAGGTVLALARDERVTLTQQPCELHSRHIPEPHHNHVHHVWPLGRGGPAIAENRIVVCPTGHANIHQLLIEYFTFRGQVPFFILRTFAFAEREYAKLAYERITRKAM